jgi:pyrimidine-specific ribonucleoside hydrolase
VDRRRLGRWWVAAAVVAIVTAAGCGDSQDGAVAPTGPTGSDTTPATAAPEPPAGPSVVVDTDLAVDDLVALAFLMSVDVDVRAITISGTGEVRCPQGLTVIRGLLELTGDDDVPIACGRSTPLVGAHEFPAGWRDAADGGWGLELGQTDAADADADAVALLRDALSDGHATLLTLGPLTNVADALRTDPTLVDGIDTLVMMGGSLDAGGNIFESNLDADFSEWNVYVDPTAADEVMASGVPIVMVGLDATNRAPVTIDFLERLAANAHTPAANVVHRLLEQNSLVYSGDAYFWDPLAAAAVVDRSVIATEPMTIDVITEDGPESGRTVRDERGDRIEVAVDADRTVLEAMLIRGLDGLSAGEEIIEPSPPVGVGRVSFDGGVCSYDGPTTVSPGRMRLQFSGDEQASAAAIAHLTGELTIEEVLDWVASNPNPQTQPPGVDVVSAVPAGGEAFLDVLPGTTAVVCADQDGNILLAATLLVR